MTEDEAIDALAALAQPSRMAVFRVLVRNGPDGLSAGEIARRLDIVPSTLSGHLSILKQNGLVEARRQQREIHYAARLCTIGEIVDFLLSDCCNGQLEHCSEIVSLLHRC